MAHTRSWSDIRPAGTDLISAGDDTIREITVDIHERMAIDHIWASSLDHDGKHKKVTLIPDNNTTEIQSATAASTTGAGTSGIVDLAKVFNTSGVVEALKYRITKTLIGAGSNYFAYYVDGTIVYLMDVNGQHNFVDHALIRPVIQDYAEVYTTPTIAAGVLTLNCELGNVFFVELTENITTLTISNWAPSAKKGSIEVWYRGDGTQRTIAHGAIRTPNGGVIAPTASNGYLTVVTYHTFDAGGTVFAIPAAYAL
jgi:hypothetical protein